MIKDFFKIKFTLHNYTNILNVYVENCCDILNTTFKRSKTKKVIKQNLIDSCINDEYIDGYDYELDTILREDVLNNNIAFTSDVILCLNAIRSELDLIKSYCDKLSQYHYEGLYEGYFKDYENFYSKACYIACNFKIAS